MSSTLLDTNRLLVEADELAAAAFENCRMPHTNEPCLHHARRVAELALGFSTNETFLACALLMNALYEGQGELDEIRFKLSPDVADLVALLSGLEVTRDEDNELNGAQRVVETLRALDIAARAEDLRVWQDNEEVLAEISRWARTLSGLKAALPEATTYAATLIVQERARRKAAAA